MKNTPPDFHFLHSLIEKTKEKEGKTSVKYHFYLFYNKKMQTVTLNNLQTIPYGSKKVCSYN